MSALATGIIAGAAALGSAATGAISAGKMNKRGVKHANDMWDKQGQREIEYWNMQNAYNDPAAQMQRLQDAGLNPNLVYGNGATTEAAGVTPQKAQPVDFKPVNMDVGSVAMSALQAQQVASNIARTDAETDAIKARTIDQNFTNQLNDLIGLDQKARSYNIATDRLETSHLKELGEYEAWQAGSFQGKATNDPTSPIAKAIKAGYDMTAAKLSNEAKLGDLRAFETTIKKYQAGLAHEGIPPDSPWYAKIIGDLIMKALNIKSLNSVGTAANDTLNINK